jgi:pyridoxamine 5'-phosphate oxidase
MIQFNNLNQEVPYLLLKDKYNEAVDAGQKGIEAISISSFNNEISEVDSRYVNLKFILNEEFIFFTNYDSPKAYAFKSNNQIAALVYWPSINVQIRMKANIKKTSKEFNQKYFFNRSEEKNALAISSNQSKPIDSYNQVKENYNKSLEGDNLKKCPEYWGWLFIYSLLF